MGRRVFGQAFDVLLEEADLFGPAYSTWQKFSEAQNTTKDIQSDLQRDIERIHQQLALEIRRNNPALTATMGRDAKKSPVLTIGYRNYGNRLTFKADPQDRSFMVGDGAFERRFKRYYGHTLALGIETLGKSISDFFNQTYKSLSR